MSDDALVLRADGDGLATLTLNRPDKLNALTPGTFVALRDHLDGSEERIEVEVREDLHPAKATVAT
jgi:enoyl-CoA hydratase/carnithine racemase